MSKKDSSMNSARVPMGTSAYSLADTPSAKDFRKGMVVPKKSGRSDAPVGVVAAPRHGVPQKTLGPRFSISVGLPGPQSPEANLTQGNGRIIPPAIRRSVDSFVAGQTDYLK